MSPDETPEHTPEPPAAPPLLRVVKGDPQPEEVAALVAVVSALASSPDGGPRPAPSQWRNRRHALRGAHHPGPGAWRASARTR